MRLRWTALRTWCWFLRAPRLCRKERSRSQPRWAWRLAWSGRRILKGQNQQGRRDSRGCSPDERSAKRIQDTTLRWGMPTDPLLNRKPTLQMVFHLFVHFLVSSKSKQCSFVPLGKRSVLKSSLGEKITSHTCDYRSDVNETDTPWAM